MEIRAIKAKLLELLELRAVKELLKFGG